MSSRPSPSPGFQRNALAPGILAAMVCIAGFALVDQELYLVARFIIAILALIIGWFAVQARQWWWMVPMLAIAVVWNPLYPIVFDGPWWIGANIAAAATFLAAGAMIMTPRAPAP